MAAEKTILIIEDSRTQAEAIRAMLRERQVRTIWAADGQTGVDLAAKHMPDLILVDIEMPGIDGVETTRLLKQGPKTQEIPVIILTAHADSRKKISEIEQDTIGYIPKDAFFNAVLLNTLRHLKLIA